MSDGKAVLGRKRGSQSQGVRQRAGSQGGDSGSKSDLTPAEDIASPLPHQAASGTVLATIKVPVPSPHADGQQSCNPSQKGLQQGPGADVAASGPAGPVQRVMQFKKRGRPSKQDPRYKPQPKKPKPSPKEDVWPLPKVKGKTHALPLRQAVQEPGQSSIGAAHGGDRSPHVGGEHAHDRREQAGTGCANLNSGKGTGLEDQQPHGIDKQRQGNGIQPRSSCSQAPALSRPEQPGRGGEDRTPSPQASSTGCEQAHSGRQDSNPGQEPPDAPVDLTCSEDADRGPSHLPNDHEASHPGGDEPGMRSELTRMRQHDAHPDHEGYHNEHVEHSQGLGDPHHPQDDPQAGYRRDYGGAYAGYANQRRHPYQNGAGANALNLMAQVALQLQMLAPVLVNASAAGAGAPAGMSAPMSPRSGPLGSGSRRGSGSGPLGDGSRGGSGSGSGRQPEFADGARPASADAGGGGGHLMEEGVEQTNPAAVPGSGGERGFKPGFTPWKAGNDGRQQAGPSREAFPGALPGLQQTTPKYARVMGGAKAKQPPKVTGGIAGGIGKKRGRPAGSKTKQPNVSSADQPLQGQDNRARSAARMQSSQSQPAHSGPHEPITGAWLPDAEAGDVAIEPSHGSSRGPSGPGKGGGPTHLSVRKSNAPATREEPKPQAHTGAVPIGGFMSQPLQRDHSGRLGGSASQHRPSESRGGEMPPSSDAPLGDTQLAPCPSPPPGRDARDHALAWPSAGYAGHMHPQDHGNMSGGARSYGNDAGGKGGNPGSSPPGGRKPDRPRGIADRTLPRTPPATGPMHARTAPAQSGPPVPQDIALAMMSFFHNNAMAATAQLHRARTEGRPPLSPPPGAAHMPPPHHPGPGYHTHGNPAARYMGGGGIDRALSGDQSRVVQTGEGTSGPFRGHSWPTQYPVAERVVSGDAGRAGQEGFERAVAAYRMRPARSPSRDRPVSAGEDGMPRGHAQPQKIVRVGNAFTGTRIEGAPAPRQTPSGDHTRGANPEGAADVPGRGQSSDRPVPLGMGRFAQGLAQPGRANLEAENNSQTFPDTARLAGEPVPAMSGYANREALRPQQKMPGAGGHGQEAGRSRHAATPSGRGGEGAVAGRNGAAQQDYVRGMPRDADPHAQGGVRQGASPDPWTPREGGRKTSHREGHSGGAMGVDNQEHSIQQSIDAVSAKMAEARRLLIQTPAGDVARCREYLALISMCSDTLQHLRRPS